MEGWRLRGGGVGVGMDEWQWRGGGCGRLVARLDALLQHGGVALAARRGGALEGQRATQHREEDDAQRPPAKRVWRGRRGAGVERVWRGYSKGNVPQSIEKRMMPSDHLRREV